MAENPFERNWTASALLRFAFPTIIMMLSMGLYTLADTIFVARFVNTDALSAINIVCPVVNLTVGLGTMIATGANAIVSRNLGAGQERAARENFTLLVLYGALLGLALFGAGLVWIDSIVTFLGASQRLFPYAKAYLEIVFLFVPAQLLQTIFSNLFVTAGKPGLGFGLSVFAGLANLVLDVLFMTRFHMGIQGAALGTGIGYSIGTIGGLVFFPKARPALFYSASMERARRHPELMERLFRNGFASFQRRDDLFVQPRYAHFRKRGGCRRHHDPDLFAVFAQHRFYRLFDWRRAHHWLQFGREKHPPAKTGVRVECTFHRMDVHRDFRSRPLERRGFDWTLRSFDVFCISNHKTRLSDFRDQLSVLRLQPFRFVHVYRLVQRRHFRLSLFLRTFVFLAGAIVLLPEILGINGIWSALPLAEGAAFILSSACCFLFRKRYGYA